MTALADDKYPIFRKTDALAREVECTLKTTKTFYNGAMCSYDSTGDVVPASDTSGEIFAGIYTGETVTTTADTAGFVLVGHVEWIAQDGNITAAMTGNVAVVLDDQTLTNATTATNDVRVGQILKLETIRGTAGCWVVTGKVDNLIVAP